MASDSNPADKSSRSQQPGSDIIAVLALTLAAPALTTHLLHERGAHPPFSFLMDHILWTIPPWCCAHRKARSSSAAATPLEQPAWRCLNSMKNRRGALMMGVHRSAM